MLGQALIPRLAWGYLNLVGWTSRVVWKDSDVRDHLLKEHGNIIYSFWHGRQVFLPWAYRGWDIYNLVSQSKDGTLIARVIDFSGMKTVRGSSSRGALQALLGLKQKLEEGKSIAITPDGPRGPQRSVHEGVLYLARETQKPVLPVAVSFSRKLVFKGWDDYWVPLPFNKIVVAHGAPQHIGKEDGKKSSEQLASALNRVTDSADRLARSMSQSAGETLFYLMYNAVLILFFPLIFIGVYAKYPKSFLRNFFDGLKTRLGIYSGNISVPENSVWIHAASLGECRAALPLVAALRKKVPSAHIVFSSTTVNGLIEAEKLHLGDTITYSPLDFFFSVNSALRKFRPRLILLLESELWPNWLRSAKNRGVSVGIINGRISARSASRYAKFNGITKAWIKKIDFVCARETADAERYVRIGVSSDRVRVSGNLKFDLFPWNLNGSSSDIEPRSGGSNPVWTAGSVRESEIPLVLDAFVQARKSIPALRLILAPRHDHAALVEKLAQEQSLSVCRRSAGGASFESVMVWDTFGDLWQAYRDSDIVFVGGSLVPLGGQNPIEPAYFKKPVIFGPYMENFEEPAGWLLKEGGAVQVQDKTDLAAMIVKILSSESLRRESGEKARSAIDRISGKATENTLQAILEHIHGA